MGEAMGVAGVRFHSDRHHAEYLARYTRPAQDEVFPLLLSYLHGFKTQDRRIARIFAVARSEERRVVEGNREAERGVHDFSSKKTFHVRKKKEQTYVQLSEWRDIYLYRRTVRQPWA